MPTPANTKARGYGYRHQQERRKWKTQVEAGQVQCHAKLCLMPTRWIDPDQGWDLGHSEDRTMWTGPEHIRCNRAEGAQRGNRSRRQTVKAKRRWAI
jgi:hypothetical protein